MKILLYGINYAPELTGIGKYAGEKAEWFSRRGHEVRVVTAPPYYQCLKITQVQATGVKTSMVSKCGVVRFMCLPGHPA